MAQKFLSICILFTLLPAFLFAQTVSVGSGSYTTVLPPGANPPQYSNGVPASPKIASGFDQKIQTTDFWSSLIFPFFNNPFSGRLFSHPLVSQADGNGLLLGYSNQPARFGNAYGYGFVQDIAVRLEGLNSSETQVLSYSDWAATTVWDDGDQRLEATIGHGLPFVFFKVNGGDILIQSNGSSVWHNENGVLALTVNGKHFAIFAPSGSTWSTSSPYRSDLNEKDYVSVAVLPDKSDETLALFTRHAYAFVTDTRVEWSYDEPTATLTTDFIYTTELKEEGSSFVNETLTALYRHQWLHTSHTLTNLEYVSPRGIMKLVEGNQFSTELAFSGVLPSMPVLGDYDENRLQDYINSETSTILNDAESTYWSGVFMGRLAELTQIADQTGNISARDYFLSQLKTRLEDWFTAGGNQQYMYNDEWDLLTGYPSGFGADSQINDHHFHSSYAIRSAAVVAQYDSLWATQDRWGGMVNMIIRDSNSWDREDPLFPFLRCFDAYAGHSWAAGHGDFPDGNNQESSSEAINFASSVFLWGSATGQKEIRDLGIFLYSNEVSAIEQYWFDVEDTVFPTNYPHTAVGIVWGGKGDHTTWFGGDPEFIHGINFLPLNGGSFYLGKHPEYVVKNYEEIIRERGGSLNVWKDIIWMYLAMGDPERALQEYNRDPGYAMTQNESRAQTYVWLKSFEKLGKVEPSITASIPQYAVFRDKENLITYAAYNPSGQTITVRFSDGFEMEVEPKELKTAESQGVFIEKPLAPTLYELHQNYPNPFNPSTTISFRLPHTAQVTLSVYSLTGQRVGIVTNQVFSAGEHQVTWNAEGLSSGVYFYRLTSDTFTETRSMILMK